MTAEELYEHFSKLNEVEKVKFERMIVGNKKKTRRTNQRN